LTLSEHLVDQLIRELIHTGRPAPASEIDAIVERMATAPFNTQSRRVPTKERGASYRGISLGRQENSLDYHLVKRVTLEAQWADGLTAEQYVADLRRAVRDPLARLAIYPRRSGDIASAITSTPRVIPDERLGVGFLPQLIVIFAADRGMIVTGYQFSTIEQTGIPPEARWLR
jgi:hypothetical protein